MEKIYVLGHLEESATALAILALEGRGMTVEVVSGPVEPMTRVPKKSIEISLPTFKSIYTPPVTRKERRASKRKQAK